MGENHGDTGGMLDMPIEHEFTTFRICSESVRSLDFDGEPTEVAKCGFGGFT